VDSSGVSHAITLGQDGTDTTLAELKAKINGAGWGITANLNGVNLSFTSASSKASVTATNLGDTTTPADTPTWTAAGSYYTVGVTNGGAGGIDPIEDTATGQVAGSTFTPDPTGLGGIATISYSDSGGENLNNTNLTTQADSQSALNELNLAISDVAAQDGYIGAQINTLNSISQVMSTQQENVVSAQNAVQATDYASATSNMSKYEILSQTGIAALAQANQVQQEVTKLLQ
jgi:flagellin